ncbi:MAG: LuxR C-terminal-related transcriptional regulator [Thermomicrobiales bacterium]
MAPGPGPLGSPPIPAARTRLLGREAEVSAARALLVQDGVPLLTLTGPGGVGKTRLALAVAEAVAPAFAGGCIWVDLSPLSDPRLVAPTVASHCGVVSDDGQLTVEALVAAFHRQQSLLLLDNCEQVIDAVAELLGRLLAGCPALQALATSRAPLRLRGEQVFPVEPLPLPAAADDSLAALQASAAVTLFVERARAARPAWLLNDATAPVVADLCRRLDGLPLALELAAAHLRVLPLDVVHAQIAAGLPIPLAGPRDLPARQQTMRATIAWSYDLLDEDARRLFRLLAVFAGGFTWAGAQAVAARNGMADAAVTPAFASLVDHALVCADGEGGAGRFRMLETMRAFGREHLVASGQEPQASYAHLAWITGVVEAAWPPRHAGPAGAWALPALDAERDNVRAALRWAIAQGTADPALRLASALVEYWWLRGDFTEGRDWLRQALSLPPGDPRLRAAALYGAAGFADVQGDRAAAVEHAASCLELAQEFGDTLDALRAQSVMSSVAYSSGDLSGGEMHIAGALRCASELNDADWIGYATIGGGYAALRRGDLTDAEAQFARAAACFVASGNDLGELNATYGLVLTMHAERADERAAPQYRRIIALGQRVSSPWGLVRGLIGLAAISAQTGAHEQAARWLGAAAEAGERMGLHANQEGRRLAAEADACVRSQLGDDRYRAIAARGRALPISEAVAEALRATDPDGAPGVLPGDGAAGALARATPGPTALLPADAVADTLTRRERQVVALLSQRLTDAEIAERLFISPRTASSHVSAILGKLGAANRREAAAVIAREGLVPRDDRAPGTT